MHENCPPVLSLLAMEPVFYLSAFCHTLQFSNSLCVCGAGCCPGGEGATLREVLQHSGVTLVDAASLEEAVKLCSEQAHSGDAVLLSPACASMDMFRNYAHRAEVFVSAVNHLVQEAGGMV